MNSVLINNLYLGWFSPDEFSLFYEEYRSRIREMLVSMLAAFSLAVAGMYIRRDYGPNSALIVLGEFLSHLFFLSIFPEILSYLADYQARKNQKTGDLNILISYSRYSISIFGLAAPFSILMSLVKLQGSTGYFVILFVLCFCFILNVIRGGCEIYKVDKSQMFRLMFSSFFFALIVPPVLCLYYLFSIVFVIF
ncbi:MAG TPA: hypothetical protein PL048_15390 [Leptospiraceae bacterium]|nr:hypothetical protein [Leptospiraceae bacterium]